MAKHTNVRGAGRMAGAKADLATWRCAYAQGLRASTLGRLLGIAALSSGTLLPELLDLLLFRPMHFKRALAATGRTARPSNRDVQRQRP
jgi:hypothetical protein